jgi:hypothetical protein
MSRVSFFAAFIAAGIWVTASPAEDPQPLVHLLISKVTAETSGRATVVTCEAIIDNASGSDLNVRSSFISAFDGLEIVVTNSEGKVLEQRLRTEHLAVNRLRGKDFPLKQGKTVEELRFPLYNLPEDTRSLRVRLVGTLPGSSYKRILSSETLTVEIGKGAGK